MQRAITEAQIKELVFNSGYVLEQPKTLLWPSPLHSDSMCKVG